MVMSHTVNAALKLYITVVFTSDVKLRETQLLETNMLHEHE